MPVLTGMAFFLYLLGHNSITWFKVNPATGQLDEQQFVSTQGALPWHFTFATPTTVIVTTQFDATLADGTGFVELFQWSDATCPAQPKDADSTDTGASLTPTALMAPCSSAMWATPFTYAINAATE
eukprot:m.351550 g.351550  ORF g.351550 m.351550 type:complete len:126 (+) comp16274_c0_seq1:2413-2790(+)